MSEQFLKETSLALAVRLQPGVYTGIAGGQKKSSPANGAALEGCRRWESNPYARWTHAPETCASTNSATSAKVVQNYKSRVPKAGIEPARYCYHWILSPARLPIPPLRLTGQPSIKLPLQLVRCKFRKVFSNSQQISLF